MKIIKNREPYSLNFFECWVRVFSNSLVKNLLKKTECFVRYSEIGPSIFKIKKFGIKFPSTAQNMACIGVNPKTLIAKGIEPLSSATGSIAEKNVINSGESKSLLLNIHVNLIIRKFASVGRGIKFTIRKNFDAE